MEVFRIVRSRYAGSLAASGMANRWNRKGEGVIYAGSSRSLSTLEQIVHIGAVPKPDDYRVNVISLPDDPNHFRRIDIEELPIEWRSMESYPSLQRIGSEWIRSMQSLILQVPSAVIPQEYNFIINTEHPDFKRRVRVKRVEEYFWDGRLLDLASKKRPAV